MPRESWQVRAMARRGLLADMAFADALQAIGQAGISPAEAKFLRRRMVEVFAAAAAAGPPRQGFSLVAVEELRAGLQEAFEKGVEQLGLDGRSGRVGTIYEGVVKRWSSWA